MTSNAPAKHKDCAAPSQTCGSCDCSRFMLESLHDKESMQRIRCRNLVTPQPFRRTISGSLAKFAAMRRASSRVSRRVAERRFARGPEFNSSMSFQTFLLLAQCIFHRYDFITLVEYLPAGLGVDSLSHAKQASKRNRRTQVVPMLGVAGLSLSLASGASAIGGPAADIADAEHRYEPPNHSLRGGDLRGQLGDILYLRQRKCPNIDVPRTTCRWRRLRLRRCGRARAVRLGLFPERRRSGAISIRHTIRSRPRTNTRARGGA